MFACRLASPRGTASLQARTNKLEGLPCRQTQARRDCIVAGKHKLASLEGASLHRLQANCIAAGKHKLALELGLHRCRQASPRGTASLQANTS